MRVSDFGILNVQYHAVTPTVIRCYPVSLVSKEVFM
ncbi:hypothetical protein SAMN00768000_0404 [Sulfobacillus thermosulfidooxidans DSM 9293]|uniref:Uncharacterized protein n=1 Tax=Sulfobacillus thermosulfidooxidans (strain DSM 9293 / VKM B-1269 / AT-1) TaxID=929705 RepID=A0A1W1W7C5_SULTA|nr:hypothetical protein SAMN00768000_0404 [Sulfobacillus thermosulfidooxidans DSM 9293]